MFVFFRSMIAVTAVLSFLSVVTQVWAQERTDSISPVPPERRAYGVRLLVMIDSKSFDAMGSQVVLRDIDSAARRCAGEMWSLKTSQVDWINPVNAIGLQRLNRSTLTENLPGETVDIWFAATIESVPTGTRLSVRSWQPEVQLETSIATTDVIDEREIALSMVRLCRDLARPMGVVEQVSDKSVRIRLRAGEIVSPDPSFTQLKKDDLLLPMFAHRDKNRVIERIQPVPWTYISVDEVEGSMVSGTIQSGVKLALGGKKRGRIDTLVTALRSQHPSTRIELLTQSKPIRPLVAHRIEVRNHPIIPRPTAENPQLDPDSTLVHELLTDRRGLASVSVVQGQSLVWLFAYSGQNLLARVPFVPGIDLQSRLEVPDDATRLSAEADLQMLQSEVIDAVALRNTSMAVIRAAAKKDDWTTVDKKLAQLKLRQQEDGVLLDRLIAVRVAGTSAAKARKDKTAEARINRMCDEATTIIKAHLSEEKVTSLIEEMDALKKSMISEKETTEK